MREKMTEEETRVMTDLLRRMDAATTHGASRKKTDALVEESRVLRAAIEYRLAHPDEYRALN